MTTKLIGRMSALLFAGVLACGAAWADGCLPFEDWKPIGPFGNAFDGLVSDATNTDHLVGVLCYGNRAPGSCIETVDGGKSWVILTKTNFNGGSSIGVLDFSAFDCRRMYLCTDANGTWRSLDGGRTWSCTPSLPDNYSKITAICAHPTDSNIVYGAAISWDTSAGGDNLLFAISTNASLSWVKTKFFDKARFAPFANNLTRVSDLAVSRSRPECLLACGNLYSFDAAIKGYYTFAALSTNGGSAWLDISSAVDSRSNSTLATATFDPSDHRRIYLGGRYLYSSADGGVSWQTNSSMSNIVALAADPEHSGVVYAQCAKNQVTRLFASSDYGMTWTAAEPGIHSPSFYSSGGGGMEIMPGNVSNVVMFSSGGVFISRDAGLTLEAGDAHLNIGYGGPLAVAPSRTSRLLLAISRSDNSGADWTEMTLQNPYQKAIAFKPDNPDVALTVPTDPG